MGRVRREMWGGEIGPCIRPTRYVHASSRSIMQEPPAARYMHLHRSCAGLILSKHLFMASLRIKPRFLLFCSVLVSCFRLLFFFRLIIRLASGSFFFFFFFLPSSLIFFLHRFSYFNHIGSSSGFFIFWSGVVYYCYCFIDGIGMGSRGLTG
ncbi:hypothetical protein P167DRAFT_439927 [Morchella conica CCBAS932]|uniref:Transmembrane protein n=1 Tax=Morchella conica CCBAS932 TaxID=1392247 RepID=A0A3N4KCA6_9PEZI|nr:hypothetical protein P167DRAFT_439927 [Morchella conica CCBAS932]